jgi:uncharacterized protein (TIGR02246 family)
MTPMKHLPLLVLVLSVACSSSGSRAPQVDEADEVARLAEMIAVREKAMIEKDVETAMSQFSDDATWINSQGYYFEGKQNVLEFHEMLAGRESMDYTYEAGEPRIRLLDASNAVAYYSWKMFWFQPDNPDEITTEEIGLMTLTAQKRDDRWYWVAVTNQHTPWFYETIDAVTIDEEE